MRNTPEFFLGAEAPKTLGYLSPAIKISLVRREYQSKVKSKRFPNKATSIPKSIVVAVSQVKFGEINPEGEMPIGRLPPIFQLTKPTLPYSGIYA